MYFVAVTFNSGTRPHYRLKGFCSSFLLGFCPSALKGLLSPTCAVFFFECAHLSALQKDHLSALSDAAAVRRLRITELTWAVSMFLHV